MGRGARQLLDPLGKAAPEAGGKALY